MTNKRKGRGAKYSKAKQDEDTTPARAVTSIASAKDFIREVKAEFKKIVWPERKMTFGLTGFVLVLVVLISMYLGTVDLLLGKLVSLVLR